MTDPGQESIFLLRSWGHVVLLWLGGLIFSQPNGIPQEELKTTLPLDCSFVGGGGGARGEGGREGDY